MKKKSSERTENRQKRSSEGGTGTKEPTGPQDYLYPRQRVPGGSE